jgi:DNA primase
MIDLILAKVDLVDIVNADVPLREKTGSNYFARCPFHQEKSASFSVSQPKQFYYCFGCGAHGNAIDFLIEHNRLSFIEAVTTLARLAGVTLPTTTGLTKKDDSSSLYDLMTKARDYFHGQLRKSPRAIDYLKNRGISGQIIEQFKIGYATNGYTHLLDLFGKTEKEKKNLLDVGLIIKKNEGGHYDRFRERIMFPIEDHRGRVIGFGGRIINEGEPKYLNSPETVLFQKGEHLYGLSQVLKANRVLKHIIIVEGYLDVIALVQHGITETVATLGTATTNRQLERLFRYTKELIFCFDGDLAGKKAAWRALQVILPIMQDNIQIRFLFLPDQEDPDSLIRKEGKAAFEKRIPSALSLSTFFFQTLAKECDLSSMEGRASFAASAIQYIKQLPPGIFQGILLEELSKRARVNLHDLKQQIENEGLKAKHLSSGNVNNKPGFTLPKTKISSPMRLAIALLIQHPTLVNYLDQPLPESPIKGFRFLTELIDIIKKTPSMTTALLREYWRGQKEEGWIAAFATWQHMVPEAGLKGEFLGAIRQIIIQGLDEEINRLLAKAAQVGLLEEEKFELSSQIARKKNLLAGPLPS